MAGKAGGGAGSVVDEWMGQALDAHRANDFAVAEPLYRRVLAAKPDHADACALLGIVVGARGALAEGVTLVDRAVALDPASGLLHFHRGTVLMAAQRLDDAVAAFERARQLQPDMAAISFNLANALRAQGDWAGAIAAYRAVVNRDPAFLAAYNNLALSLVHEGQYEEALGLARQAVTRDPSFGEGWLTLCNVAEKLKDYPQALAAGERARDLMPGNHFAWFGYGVALNRTNQDEQAIFAYKRALALNPARADILDNLAQTYQSLNRLAEAEATFRQAVTVAGQALTPDPPIDETLYGHRHWHLALIELLRGDYPAGFARYRSRFKEIKALRRPVHAFPLWQGEDLAGKSLLVNDEQGYGDTLMLARFLPLLQARGARIVLTVHPALLPLLDGWAGADQVLPHGVAVPDCDYFCSTFDLPRCLGTTLDNLPHDVPYLPVLPPDGDTLLPATAQSKVGVVWGGSPLHLNDLKRSIPLDQFSRLFQRDDVRFYSFNRDLKLGDAERLPRLAVENLAPRLTDFAVAARLLGQMNLVITADTATAHLAGGLGLQVWILLPFAPDWRWLTGRDDSPWYPTARLFRQREPGDWGGVIESVAGALADFVSN